MEGDKEGDKKGDNKLCMGEEADFRLVVELHTPT